MAGQYREGGQGSLAGGSTKSPLRLREAKTTWPRTPLKVFNREDGGPVSMHSDFLFYLRSFSVELLFIIAIRLRGAARLSKMCMQTI